MLGNNCNTSPVNTKSCIEIKDWNSNPQSKGCIKHKGKYYINRITGNTATPEQGILSGSYVVGSEDYCDIIAYHSSNQTTCEESAVFMKFFYGIEEYSNCTEGTTFDCDEFIIFKNIDGVYELHQSLISNNSRHPHDREAWKSLGDFSNILKLIFNEADGKQITLPYWEECKGPNCASVYSKDSSVVEKVDSGEVDNCGNPVYNELIYQSVIDKNTDRPSLGVDKDDPTWLGPYTDMEWVTRQVGYTVNGEDISAGDNHILVSKDDVSSDNFEWIMTEGVINLVTKPIGVDQNGKVITNGSQAELLSKDTFCDKFEWVEVETGECEVDCDPVMKNVICPKPVGVDENGDVINNGSESELISTYAVYEPLQWVDVEEEECLEDCTHPTKKRITLCIEKGLHIVDSCLEVFLDMTKGLGFNADGSIFVKIKNGLGFTNDGEIEVVPANNSIIVNENGVSVGQIGVDRNGQPVMAGDCLVTCSTDLHVIAIDDTGTETTLTISDGTTVVGPEEDITVQSIEDTGTEICITLTNGSVICGVKIDNDDFVSSTSSTRNSDNSITIVLTMDSGNTHTIDVPAAAVSGSADGVVDGYTTGVSGEGINLTRTEGLPPLTINASVKLGVYSSANVQKVWPITDGAKIQDPLQEVTNVNSPVSVDNSGNLVMLRDACIRVDNWHNIRGPLDFQGSEMGDKYSSSGQVFVNGVQIGHLHIRHTHFSTDHKESNLTHHTAGASTSMCLSAGDVIEVRNLMAYTGDNAELTIGEVIGVNSQTLTITELQGTFDLPN